MAYGIPGSGDKLIEIFEVMKKIKQEYNDRVDIRVSIRQGHRLSNTISCLMS